MGITASIDISAEQRRILLDLIQQHLPNTAIWAFGSRVKWTTRSNSDLDLAAFATPQQDPQVSALKEAFEESNLPFRVDLLVWDKLPENFQRNIQEGYVVLVEGKELEWEGNIGFITNTLKSMCELIVDCPHSTPEWTDSGVVVLRNQNIKNGVLDLSAPSFTNQEGYLKRIKRAAPAYGDIVITREAPMGEVCMIPNGLKCCLGQRQVLLRPKSTINGKYLFWALQSPFVQEQISWNEGTGSTVSNVRIPVLEALKIPRFPGNEDMIAFVLSSIADKIELNRQTNQTLEQIAQALFKSWFVDFEPVKAKMAAKQAGASAEQIEQAAICAISGKTPEQLAQLDPQTLQQLKTTAALFPDALVDSELGEIPEGWGIQTVEDIIELVYGKALNKTVRIDGEFPVYGSGGLTGKHNQSLVEGPGIIVGRKGTVGSLFWEDRSFYPIDTVFYVKSKNGMTLEFSYYLLQILGLEDMNTDAAVPGLNRNNVYRLELPNYPKVLIEEYSKIIGNIRNKIRFVNNEVVTLENIRDSLLPKLLSGEINLSNANEAA